ncbi:hypothetical protein [Leeia aquatica]|uniref:Uncharacterized protein n=1 Tax=Leeia aquatica TaxID=2725557 RepID=A0A847RV27_9NEIS|nr:hypothetical protein [Leeia aquatica]NLR73691.1 hypothetical protein [Leeia aquatica]
MATNRSDSNNQGDELLIQILDDLLYQNVDITARAVARLHPHIGHASTITCNLPRSELVAQYQAKQQDIRKHISRLTKRSKESTAAELESKDRRIAELERQVDLLRASHLAMIRAVGELGGGMNKWVKFFEGYKDARDQLYQLDAMPLTLIGNTQSGEKTDI